MTAIEKAIQAVGTQAELSRLINELSPGDRVSPQAVNKWLSAKTVPPKRVLLVEQITGISRYELRPDIYGESGDPQPVYYLVEKYLAGENELEQLRARVAELEGRNELVRFVK